MKIRFQADADLNQIIVTGLLRREPRIDCQSATALGLQGLTDRDVLTLAAQQKRILVSHDRKTMPTHFANFITTNQSTGLLIISKKLAVDIVIEELLLIWEISSAEEWINRIANIPL